MSQAIQIGDTVTWASQSGGHEKTKTGKVIACVVVGISPRNYALKHFPDHNLMFDGHIIPRGSNIAYLVEVREKPNQKPKLYMPRPKRLVVLKKESDE